MDSSQTLHDFVLNLLSDPQARTAFELDPEGALQDAGLSDVTAADVQDVVPLVIDYAPVNGLTDLDTDQLGLGSLGTGPDGAIQQLQLVTQQLPSLSAVSSTEASATAAGALTAAATGAAGLTAGGLTSWASVSASGGDVEVSTGTSADTSGAPDAFSASADVSTTLDADALATPGVDVGDLPHTADGLVDTVDGTTGTVTNLLDLDGLTGGASPDLTGTVHDLTGGLTDSLGVDLGHPAATLPAHVPSVGAGDGVDSTVSSLTDTVHGAGVTDLVGDHSPLADTTHHLPAGDALSDATDLLF